MINVMLIGSGGREHALAWKLSQSPLLNRLFCIPGNPGTAQYGRNLPQPKDYQLYVELAHQHNIELVIIGPENPLASGLSDLLQKAGLMVFGPSADAAQIEASKVYSKEFMKRHKIPTPSWEVFNSITTAKKYIDYIAQDPDHGVESIVIKASGLAGGKGTFLPNKKHEAKRILHNLLVDGFLGNAGKEVIIEKRLYGPEISLMAFTDGDTIVLMPPAQDHKRLLDGNRGPNTGGMGACAPVVLQDEDKRNILDKIFIPAIRGLRDEGKTFLGVLYAGLILTTDGLQVLEFNCRFGDPEAQAVLPLLKSDLLSIILSCTNKKLSAVAKTISWSDKSTACVVLISPGYPENPKIGSPVFGFDKTSENVIVFNAGTQWRGDQLVTSGGRVLSIVGVNENLPIAINLAYEHIKKISFDGMQFRADIGKEKFNSHSLGKV